MSPKPLRLRPRARADIAAIMMHYRGEAGEALALAFVEALERAFRPTAHHPTSGSPRYGHEARLPGLRAWPLRRFPYLVLYFERAEDVDVVRVLHAKRDIPAWLQAPDEDA